jgi:hypothetical protein
MVSVTPRPSLTPGTHWTGGWKAPEPVWTQSLEEKSFCLCRGSNLDSPVLTYSTASHFTAEGRFTCHVTIVTGWGLTSKMVV